MEKKHNQLISESKLWCNCSKVLLLFYDPPGSAWSSSNQVSWNGFVSKSSWISLNLSFLMNLNIRKQKHWLLATLTDEFSRLITKYKWFTVRKLLRMVRKRPEHEFDGGVIGGRALIGIIEMAEGTTLIWCTGQGAFWSRRGSEFPKGIRSERDRSRLEGNSPGRVFLIHRP